MNLFLILVRTDLPSPTQQTITSGGGRKDCGLGLAEAKISAVLINTSACMLYSLQDLIFNLESVGWLITSVNEPGIQSANQ